jgi:hypothetical protein
MPSLSTWPVVQELDPFQIFRGPNSNVLRPDALAQVQQRINPPNVHADASMACTALAT